MHVLRVIVHASKRFTFDQRIDYTSRSYLWVIDRAFVSSPLGWECFARRAIEYRPA